MPTAEGASWDLYEMIQAFLQAPGYHLFFEAALIIWIIRLLFMKSYKPQRTDLTEQEKEELIRDWQPEPLVPDVEEDNLVLQKLNNRLVKSIIGKHVKINDTECLNMASLNFLAMVGRPEIEDVAVQSLRKYGVGSCGPRGFYGTVDVHLTLEERLAAFMGVEEAIIYSYGFATIASAIPAYSKRGDLIFCDEGASFSIQKGVQASRSRVVYFKHNDMEDLERLLQEQQRDDLANPKKAKVTRRFIVVEGISINHADICPLPKLVELKWKYKVRIFLDETISFGTMGRTGKGVTEHFGIDIDQIDLMSASLENAFGSIGGFCCGRSYVVDHQRLSGLGYCFSASQPPMLAAAAITALDLLQQDPQMVINLQKNAEYLHKGLKSVGGLKLHGDALSPIKHLYLQHSTGDRASDIKLLSRLEEQMEQVGVAVTIASYLDSETIMPPPSIRLAVNCDLNDEEMSMVVIKLSNVCKDLNL